MMSYSILARSFSRHEQKRLGYLAVICFLISVLFFCTFFKPYLDPLPAMNLQLSMGVGPKMLAVKVTTSSQQMIIKSSMHENKYWLGIMRSKKEPRHVTVQFQEGNSTAATSDHQAELLIEEVMTNKTQPVVLCNAEEARTELCEIMTDARVDSKSSLVFVISSPQINQHVSEEGNASLSTIIRPYARKEDTAAMSKVRKWSVLLKPSDGLQETQRCTRNHSVPAVLFSLGGYVGNNFHEFSDVVIPLFITSRHYSGEVQFLITDYKSNFVTKFQKVLKGLSKYEPIDIDKEDQRVHCFPSATVGLKRLQKDMSIDPVKHSTSMKEFRDFLRNLYSLNRTKAITISDNIIYRKPRLLILLRQRTRAFTNTGEIRAMATSLGYKVTIAEADSNFSRFSEVVNSCDVLMGVHGAGLTNMVFLPENAVFIQILPFGGFEWMAKNFYGEPSKEMNLDYLEYKISKEESTLINQYPLDHAVFTDPYSIKKQGKCEP